MEIRCLDRVMILAANIDTTGTIFNKAPQILGYVDDVDIIEMDMRSLTTAVNSIVAPADDIG